MAESNQGPTQDLTAPTCPVCRDKLDDPRVLLCGHSYCGPPKDCLKAVQKTFGAQCAVCNQESRIKVDQLKPLYGIREFLQQSATKEQNKGEQKSLDVMCQKHPESPVLFWCESCKGEACLECFNSTHQKHSGLVNYREHLQERVGPSYENIMTKVVKMERLAITFVDKMEKRTFDQKTQKMNAVKKARGYLDDLKKFSKKSEDIGKFIEDSRHHIDLNKVKDFQSHIYEFELHSILERLDLLRVEYLTDFKFTTEITLEDVESLRTEELRTVEVTDKNVVIQLQVTYNKDERKLYLKANLNEGKEIPTGQFIPGESPYFCRIGLSVPNLNKENHKHFRFKFPKNCETCLNIQVIEKYLPVSIKVEFGFIFTELLTPSTNQTPELPRCSAPSTSTTNIVPIELDMAETQLTLNALNFIRGSRPNPNLYIPIFDTESSEDM